jgi:hypothetical protein
MLYTCFEYFGFSEHLVIPLSLNGTVLVVAVVNASGGKPLCICE